jgi:hypothetical protein
VRTSTITLRPWEQLACHKRLRSAAGGVDGRILSHGRWSGYLEFNLTRDLAREIFGLWSAVIDMGGKP